MSGARRPAAGMRDPFPTVYRLLRDHFGPRHWWPAETEFEVMAGAILTQNTAWSNVTRAMAALRERSLLDPAAMLAAPEGSLAEAIRPCGYFNVKTRRLRHLCAALLADGGVEGWRRWRTQALRERLLGIHGVGEETADCILLYVYYRPVFVIDAYTRRVFSRLELLDADARYRSLAEVFENALGEDPALYNEYHAQIVALGNRICRPRPRCRECPLIEICPMGRHTSRSRPGKVLYGE